MLAPWAAAFEAVYGWGPTARDIARDELPGADLFTLTFRPDFEPIEMIGGTGHFAHRAAMAAHVRRMGFDWADGRVITAPSPETLNALADAIVGPGEGYRAGYIVEDRRNLTLGRWLLRYLEGRVPVHVASEGFYRAIPAGPRWINEGLRFHFGSFAHDLTVHALNYHLIPRRFIDAVRDRVVAALPERHAAWHAPGAEGPLTLTTFFDNDINRYGYDVWSRSETPRDFARVFLAERNLAQIMACLDLRLDETLRGLGDVPSGDTKDMHPLAAFGFTIQG